MPHNIKLIECPRDAMQGWKEPIPTSKKVQYINTLLQVGFDTIDFGSFVSPRLIPQMADTKEVVKQLKPGNSSTKLLAIVANTRGADEASTFDEISCLGFPFSISETFQQRNANSTILEALDRVEEIQDICIKKGKQLVVYISMAFGNPYGDEYSPEILYEWVKKIASLDVSIISLADTVGVAEAENVNSMTGFLVDLLPDIEIGVHLHSTLQNWKDKVQAAFYAGCRRFDGALKGIGGCPMAGDVLVGNMNTGLMINYFNDLSLLPPLNNEALQHSLDLADDIFKH
ncbi:MAG: hydroxymethylglutaryl-CoA lyase [Chitinophagaceae bacterium]